MNRWRTFACGVLLTFVCCDGQIATGPTPPPPNTTTTSAPEAPPRVDEPFEFLGNIGFSLFAGARAEPTDIIAVFHNAQSRLGGRPFARVCGELQSWPSDRPWLPRGSSAVPFNDSAPAAVEVKRFLDTTATIRGAQVLLVPICNLKEDGTSPANRERWVRTMARLAAQYQNVALEVVNEWKHPNSTITEQEVINLIRAAKAECPRCLVGTDDNFHPRRITYNRAIRAHVDYPSAHPWRNPDPTARQIRDMVDANGGFLVLSETTAYDGDNLASGGLVTQDRNQIIRYMQNCQAVSGCVFVYHSLWGLGWPEMPLGWFPPG